MAQSSLSSRGFGGGSSSKEYEQPDVEESDAENEDEGTEGQTEEMQTIFQVEQIEVDGPFSTWGFPTPPGASGYEVSMPEEDVVTYSALADSQSNSGYRSGIVADRLRADMKPTLQSSGGCSVYSPAPFRVCGAIREKYDSIGGVGSFLSFPKSGELTNPDGVGKRTEFLNGAIYWHPETGAHSVSVPVSFAWARNGWERGYLGYPTTSDFDLGDGWFKQDFQGGHVYTHNLLPPSQASIRGEIFKKWQSLGGGGGDLGYPVSDELATPDGIGRYSVFESGMIYWTPKTGAHYVAGAIGAMWMSSGFELSEYGYPTSDQYFDSKGRMIQNFSKKPLDLSSFFNSEETIKAGDKEISKDLVDFLRKSGISEIFYQTVPAGPSLQSGHWIPRQNDYYKAWYKRNDLHTPNSGKQFGWVDAYMVSPVKIPPEYKYDLRDKDVTLHDFCTKWPDGLIYDVGMASYFTADLRGPCANHDMCYEKLPIEASVPAPLSGTVLAPLLSTPSKQDFYNFTTRLATCDPNLLDEVKEVCDATSRKSDRKKKFIKNRCNSTAEAMYTGVISYQINKAQRLGYSHPK